jgi:hypothetical protein
MKGGQYPDPDEKRTSQQLREELEILKHKLHLARPHEGKEILRQIKEIQLELTRRLQNGRND